jgi:hypothetical protein
MFLRGKITIDPSQLTNIEIHKPENSFKKMFYHITGGKIGNKKEVETFKAVSIIQQLKSAFATLGIDNIVRLNHDDIEIYFDSEGKKADFDFAVDKYTIEIDESMSSYFNQLWMVLEHEDPKFKYLIEVSVNRSHQVNEYPIEIIVSGLIKEFAGQTQEDLKARMQRKFSSQYEYDQYVNLNNLDFKRFLDYLAFEIKKNMRIDDIKTFTKQRMVIDREKQKQAHTQERPIYGGTPYSYYGFDNFLMYSLLWSTLCYDNHIHIADTEVINQGGDYFGEVGSDGMEVGEGTVFDESIATEEFGDNLDIEHHDESFDEPDSSDFDSGAESVNHDFAEPSFAESSMDNDSSSWFSSDSDSSWFDSDSGGGFDFGGDFDF